MIVRFLCLVLLVGMASRVAAQMGPPVPPPVSFSNPLSVLIQWVPHTVAPDGAPMVLVGPGGTQGFTLPLFDTYSGQHTFNLDVSYQTIAAYAPPPSTGNLTAVNGDIETLISQAMGIYGQPSYVVSASSSLPAPLPVGTTVNLHMAKVTAYMVNVHAVVGVVLPAQGGNQVMRLTMEGRNSFSVSQDYMTDTGKVTHSPFGNNIAQDFATTHLVDIASLGAHSGAPDET